VEGQNFDADPKLLTRNNLLDFAGHLVSRKFCVKNLLTEPRMDDDDDFLGVFILMTTGLMVAAHAIELLENDETTILKEHIREQRRLCRSLPTEKTRPTWTGFCNRVSDTHFRRQFRMNRNTFSNLCNALSTVVGEDTFRSESGTHFTRNSASLSSRGGLIPGEIKVAISLRLLAGGSYLDLMPLFDVSVSCIYVIFDEFLGWVLAAFDFPLRQFLHDENWCALENIAEPFSYSSDGAFRGIIGALDGLAVRIRSPQLTEVSDPGNYYCRKGFFALNVQAICDRSRKFIWCYTSNKGSTHDSMAFSNSRLYELLLTKVHLLETKGFYLIGDSAYNLAPFLLVPYSTDDVRHERCNIYDAFNFYLSSSRIHIECAFGQLVRRWGILWKTLHFDLVKCQRIIQVCMLLHNFINDDKDSDSVNSDECDWRPHNQQGTNGDRVERAFPLVTDNNEQDVGGRRSEAQEQYRLRGEAIRRTIAVLLHANGMKRPLYSGMRYNEFGHIFFDG
jgi:hypothetical protein